MDKNYLLEELRSLRLKLYETAEARGSLTDPDVLAISEEADQLIVALQYLQRNELRAANRRGDRYSTSTLSQSTEKLS